MANMPVVISHSSLKHSLPLGLGVQKAEPTLASARAGQRTSACPGLLRCLRDECRQGRKSGQLASARSRPGCAQLASCLSHSPGGAPPVPANCSMPLSGAMASERALVRGKHRRERK